LDNVTLGDSVGRLASQLADFEVSANNIGLSLNHGKMLGLSTEFPSCSDFSGLGFRRITPGQEELLGSPLSDAGVAGALNEQRAGLSRLTTQLSGLSFHEGFFLLGHALAMPKLMFLLRSSPCFCSSSVGSFDRELRSALSHTTNCNFTDACWLQAGLPVRFGGLGIQRACNLAASAYLASLQASEQLSAVIFSPKAGLTENGLRDSCLVSWRNVVGSSITLPASTAGQRGWTKPVYRVLLDSLIASSSGVDRAMLLAVSSPHSGVWINALPSHSLGLHLGNEETRIAI